jgi:ParB family chromosome partitioning protein
LAGAELTALERDQHIAKWVELNAAKVSQSGTPGGKQPKAKGIRAAQRELGIQKNDASRAIKVASLSQDAKQAAIEAGLDDNRTALLAAAKEPTPAAQKAVISTYAEKKSTDRNKIDGDVKARAAKEVAIPQRAGARDLNPHRLGRPRPNSGQGPFVRALDIRQIAPLGRWLLIKFIRHPHLGARNDAQAVGVGGGAGED